MEPSTKRIEIPTKKINFSEDFFHRLPKTDLHVHLDGSLRLETIMDIAEKEGVDLGVTNIDQLRNVIKPGKIHKSLKDYLKGFDITLQVMQTEESIYRCAYELAEDAAKENVHYMEVRYAPVLHTHKGLSETTIVESVLAGLRDAERDFGIRSGVIVCGIRHISPDISLKLSELCVAYKNRGVIAFDLAGAEDNNPAKEHLAAFTRILSNNVNVTIHAGEAYGPDSIHQALHYCGAHRIGHGTRLKEDGDLLNYVNNHRVPLEVCISSNIQTGVVKSVIEHPFKFYFDLGLRVNLNTDNRLITDTTMTKEFLLAYKTFDLNPSEILDLAVNGIKSAFLSFEVKKSLIRKVKFDIIELMNEYVNDQKSEKKNGEPMLKDGAK